MTQHDIFAFSLEQASQLANVTVQRLRYWDTTGLLQPKYAERNRRQSFSRLYSFRDVVSLRVLGILRDKHRIPLQTLREVDAWLKENYQTPWSSLRFYVSGKSVFFVEPESGALVAGKPAGQTALTIQMEEIAGQVSSSIDGLRRRGPDQIGHVNQSRGIVSNAPTVAGTRVLTASVWDLHSEGYDAHGIRRFYPSLTDEDIAAAVSFERHRQTSKRAG